MNVVNNLSNKAGKLMPVNTEIRNSSGAHINFGQASPLR